MALRWKNFVPNTPLKAAEVNDLANNGCVQIDTAADLDDPNLVEANLAFDLATSTLYHRAAAGVGADKWAPADGLPGLGGWATITDTPTSTYTDSAGVKWNVWTFTADGTINVTKAGLLDCLVVGGGGYGNGTYLGSGARVFAGITMMPVGAHSVLIADGGTWATDTASSSSAIGTVITAPATGSATVASAASSVTGAGGTTADPRAGLSSSITGTAVVYGTAAVLAPAPNRGEGRGADPTGNGSSGIVIVRRPA